MINNKSILDLLKEITLRHGKRIALQTENMAGIGGITYNELRERAVDVSASLIRMGLKKNDRVAILSENRPEWVIALFGIVSAAGVTVPMDVKLSECEIDFILRDSGSRFLFVSKSFLPAISRLRKSIPSLEHANVICFDPVDGHHEFIQIKDMKRKDGDRLNRPDEVNNEDTAVIVYTSGTMGTAKGVELSYGNLLFEVKALHSVISIKEIDRFVSILPLNHMLEITGGLIVPLYGGASITYAASLKPDGLIALMQKVRATGMICVPLVLKMFHNGIKAEIKRQSRVKQVLAAALLWASKMLLKINVRAGKYLFGPVHKQFGGQFKAFICGGAPMEPLVVDDFSAMGFDVLQGYGLTESSPVVTFNTFKKKKFNSVGVPLKGMEIKILKNSETGGQEGEIVVRGPNIMKGYYKSPEKTAEVIKNGWLYTGDIGWIDKDGFLYISGRLRNLIVLGVGKKVFPEEVEEVMLNSPYIKEICVLGKVLKEGSRKGCEEVYAVVVPNLEYFDEKAGTNDKIIRDRISSEIDLLSKNLAGYKKIRDFELRNEELPKTSTRKIKRKALLESIQNTKKQGDPEENMFVEEEKGEEDEFTSRMRKIAASVVNVPDRSIKRQTNLYNDLGVDSLMKVELLSAIEKELGLIIPDDIAYEINTFGDLVRLASEYKEGRIDDVSVKDEEINSVLRVNPLLRVSRFISTCLFRIFAKVYFRLEVKGSENIPGDSSFVIACNHSSMLDFPILFSSLPLSRSQNVIAPAAQDYFYSNLFKRMVVELSFNTFAFERFGNYMKGLKICSEIIKRGRSIILFPEGTRSENGELLPFKPGIGSLASALDVAVVPTYINGIYDALPKGAFFPRPLKVTVLFGEPVYADRKRKENKTDYEFYKEVALQVEKKVEDLRKSISLGGDVTET